jgi:plasmid replication initiation protein
MSLERELAVKLWRIIFYLGDKVYDIEDVPYARRPTQYAKSMLGIATHFEIELLG